MKRIVRRLMATVVGGVLVASLGVGSAQASPLAAAPNHQAGDLCVLPSNPVWGDGCIL